MKKTYQKPFVFAESFEMAEHIASGCAYLANFGADCPITEGSDDFGSVTFFAVTGCDPDSIEMIQNRFGEDTDISGLSLSDIIPGLNAHCYNSFMDFTQMYVS